MIDTPKVKFTYRLREVCEHLSCSMPTVFRLMRDGELHGVKRGRNTLIPHTELMRFLDSLPAAEASESRNPKLRKTAA